MTQCLECGDEMKSFRDLSHHLKSFHCMTSQEYYDKHHGKTQCLNCREFTSFKNLNEGYRKYCNKSCATSYRMINDENFRELLKIRTPEDLEIFLNSEISKRV